MTTRISLMALAIALAPAWTALAGTDYPMKCTNCGFASRVQIGGGRGFEQLIRMKTPWSVLSFLLTVGQLAYADEPNLPPIECPLHKAGIDPAKLKPFAEVEKYIQFLERPDRAKWQKPDEVVEALGLKGSELVADLGAGSGYFTFRLSKALPQGGVIAIDTEPEMVRHVHRKVIAGEWPNVRAQVGKPDDPGLPTDADLVFVCDVLMHVPQKSEWLKTIRSEMKAGARLVLIDFREGHLPEGPPEAVKVPKARVLRLCQEAGFTLQEDHSELLPYQNFLVFER